MRQRKAAEKKEKENKSVAIQVDDLLTFRQFSKKSTGDGLDVRRLFNSAEVVLTRGAVV